MPDRKILIVDDEDVLRTSLETNFRNDNFCVKSAASGEAAIEVMESFSPMVVLLDLRLPRMDGIEVLKKIRKMNEEIHVIMMTAYGDTQTTVEAVKCGAYNFINKPFELEELEALVKNAFENFELKREVNYLRYRQQKLKKYGEIVGKSRVMQEIYSQIDRIANTKDTTILIRGESGTGKELVAGAIHHKSKRHNQPFMEINCSSLPETLLESELFGHEKGAFTDAKSMKKGLFELADKGTIFLDEIGELPLSIQVKLLGFLEKKQFKRLGCGGKDIKVDVRIVTATNRNLEDAISQGIFREDLYYRLNVVAIFLPPLRNRKSDIPVLAEYFLEQFCREMGKKSMKFSDEALELLTHHKWRGNVRQLKNVVERAVIFTEDEIVGKDSLGAEFSDNALTSRSWKLSSGSAKEPDDINEALTRKEIDLIARALQKTSNNKTKAAKLLGISRFALNRRLQRLDVPF